MAKKKEVETTEEVVQEQVEQIQEEKTPEVDLSKFESKDDDSVIKVDTSQPVKETKTEEVVSEETPVEEVVEEKQEKEEVLEQNAEAPILEEITEEEIS